MLATRTARAGSGRTGASRVPRSPSGRVEFESRAGGGEQRSATADQIVHDHEGLAGGLADGEEPVVSHDECPLALHVLGETFTLLEREREAFPVVVADVAVEHRGVLHEVLEPVLERRDRERLGHVGVEHDLPGKSLWIAPWITKPAVFTSAGPSSTLPSASILIRFEAVTSL